MTQEVAVVTRGLTKRYGESTVVSDLNMVVPRGAVYGFLGPNGAGKSTTMKMLLGLVHPTCGGAQVLGVPMTPENRLELLRNVGSLIESPSCYPHLTARENLEIVSELRGLPAGEIDDALRIVRLDGPSAQRKRVGHFSLGMRQRLASRRRSWESRRCSCSTSRRTAWTRAASTRSARSSRGCRRCLAPRWWCRATCLPR